MLSWLCNPNRDSFFRLEDKIDDLADAVEVLAEHAEEHMADVTRLTTAVDRLIALVEQLVVKVNDPATQGAIDLATSKLDAESDKVTPVVTPPPA